MGPGIGFTYLDRYVDGLCKGGREVGVESDGWTDDDGFEGMMLDVRC